MNSNEGRGVSQVLFVHCPCVQVRQGWLHRVMSIFLSRCGVARGMKQKQSYLYVLAAVCVGVVTCLLPQVGREKTAEAGLSSRVVLEIGDAQDLSEIADGSVDKVTIWTSPRNQSTPARDCPLGVANFFEFVGVCCSLPYGNVVFASACFPLRCLPFPSLFFSPPMADYRVLCLLFRRFVRCLSVCFFRFARS